MASKLRRSLRFARACLFRATGLLWFAKFCQRKRGAALVLTLHRVLDEDEFRSSSSLPGILLRKSTFHGLAEWAAREFQIVDLGVGAPAWDLACSRPRLAITFDDGWLDNLKHAAPIAAKYGVPFTVFVCSGLTGDRFPFWPERVSREVRRMRDRAPLCRLFPFLERVPPASIAETVICHLKQVPKEELTRCIRELELLGDGSAAHNGDEPNNQAMSWEQVREIVRFRVAIGSHTVHHPILTSVAEDSVWAEISQSRKDIEAQLGLPCTMLAYPNGNHNAHIRSIAMAAGYNLGFTTERGLWTRETDSLRIPRINISEAALVGPTGRFSRWMAEYALFGRVPWRTLVGIDCQTISKTWELLTFTFTRKSRQKER